MKTPEDIIEFLESEYGFMSRHQCGGVFKNGRPCDRWGVVRLDVGPRCLCHSPSSVKSKIIERRAAVAAASEIKFNRWADAVEQRILDLYERAAPFRRVPPPEIIGSPLLRYIQEDRCLICMSSNSHLIEDHCHETGMVRALLCASCNTIEGRAHRRPWHIYREKAPANGWYLRYDGMGAEWQPGDPDPLPNRMKVEFDIRKLATDRLHGVREYLDVVNTMPSTPIPNTCERKFKNGIPMLLPGERYLETSERQLPGQWPIKTIP